MKIVTIVGARPQFIKAASVSHAISEASGIEESILHTGQHYDRSMSEVFFTEMGIPTPKWNLNVGSASHGNQTARMLVGIEEILQSEKPDWLLVYGDTNSTLAGALAASKLQIPVAHVEAGLRSYNRSMPEEINRVLTDHASTLLFAPTDGAYQTLLDEGIAPEQIDQVGDVMYDGTKLFTPLAEAKSHLLADLKIEANEYSILTLHRAENTDSPERLSNIWHHLLETARQHTIILPLHPRTRAALERDGLPVESPGLRIIEPVGYIEMLTLLKHARTVITDSGGLQKEAFFNKVPCLTLRTETEWTELVSWGWNRLCPNPQPNELSQFISEQAPGSQTPADAYGGGIASNRIVEHLLNFSTTQQA